MEPSSLRVPSLSGRLALLFPSSPVRMKLYSQYIHPQLFCQADGSGKLPNQKSEFNIKTRYEIQSAAVCP